MKKYFFLLLPISLFTYQFSIPVESTTLNNGLEVLVVEDHSSPLVSVQVWYRVGSRYEHEGLTGISHLLEHMMFKGTKKRKPQEYSEIIQRYGGIDNAFTSKDKTAYWSVLPSRYVEIALDLESDRMTNAAFREFEAEKNVVMEERRWGTENSPWGTLYEHLTAISYLAHPYRNPVIGWMSDLEGFTLDDIKDYYKTYYSPQNAILIIAGDIEKEKVFALAEKYFGKLKNRGEPIRPVKTIEPPQLGEKRATLKKESFVTMIGISYHTPSFSDSDFPSVFLLAKILTDGKSSRLHRALVEEKGIAVSQEGWMGKYIDPALFYIFLTLREGRTSEEAIEAIDSIIESIAENSVSESELQRVKNRSVSQFIFKQQSIQDKAEMVANFTLLDSEYAVNEWIPRLKDVTADDIKKSAIKYLSKDNRNIVVLEPIQKAEK